MAHQSVTDMIFFLQICLFNVSDGQYLNIVLHSTQAIFSEKGPGHYINSAISPKNDCAPNSDLLTCSHLSSSVIGCFKASSMALQSPSAAPEAKRHADEKTTKTYSAILKKKLFCQLEIIATIAF